MMSDNVM